MSGFDAVTLVPPNAEMWGTPTPPVYCLDCDRELEPPEQWQVVDVNRLVGPLCRRCMLRRRDRWAAMRSGVDQ